MLTINIIGAGKVGMSLGYFIAQNNVAKIINICNQSLHSAKLARAFIGQGTAIGEIKLLQEADIFLITTPDDKISIICEQLVLHKKLKNNNTIIHCSGVLSSDVLLPAKHQGCHVVSMHPAASFMQPITDLSFYNNIYIALEGNLSAIKNITNILEQFRIKHLIINNRKANYHLSTVMVSNFLVGLFYEAENLISGTLINAVDKDEARTLLLSLLSSVVENLKTNTTKSSLTGPVARGDQSTIKKHLEVLSDVRLREIYKNLSLAILELSSHSEAIKKTIAGIIKEL